ncbi:MAG: hypothetical protein NTZ17_08095 [Phycisphaerae bacterium]|nr:hypothetical protein [Phycisphaerae bacterium]
MVDEGRSSKRLTVLCAGLSADATRSIPAINDLYTLFYWPSDVWGYGGMASYLIFDRNKWVLSGDWDVADPDLVRQF